MTQHHWPLPSQDPIIPIAFKDPNLVAVISVISDPPRRATTELFNNAEAPSQIYFAQLWNVCLLDIPGVSKQILHNKFTLTFQST